MKYIRSISNSKHLQYQLRRHHLHHFCNKTNQWQQINHKEMRPLHHHPHLLHLLHLYQSCNKTNQLQRINHKEMRPLHHHPHLLHLLHLRQSCNKTNQYQQTKQEGMRHQPQHLHLRHRNLSQKQTIQHLQQINLSPNNQMIHPVMIL